MQYPVLLTLLVKVLLFCDSKHDVCRGTLADAGQGVLAVAVGDVFIDAK